MQDKRGSHACSSPRRTWMLLSAKRAADPPGPTLPPPPQSQNPLCQHQMAVTPRSERDCTSSPRPSSCQRCRWKWHPHKPLFRLQTGCRHQQTIQVLSPAPLAQRKWTRMTRDMFLLYHDRTPSNGIKPHVFTVLILNALRFQIPWQSN